MKLSIPVIVEAPDDATHYIGSVDDMGFYKCRQIGVAGDHWFSYSEKEKQWKMVSHYQPHWILPIPEEWKAND